MRRVEVRKDRTKSILEQVKVVQGAKAQKAPTKSVLEPKKAASSTRKIVVKEFRANTDFNDIDGLVKAAKVGATCHLILGIDADRVNESLGQGVAGIVDWLSKFQGRIGKADPHVFAATVFVLDRPANENARLDEMDVNRLIEAGACFREKRTKYYKPDVDFAAALRKDLSDTGVISSEEEETLSMPQAPPLNAFSRNRGALEILRRSRIRLARRGGRGVARLRRCRRVGPLAALNRGHRRKGHAERS